MRLTKKNVDEAATVLNYRFTAFLNDPRIKNNPNYKDVTDDMKLSLKLIEFYQIRLAKHESDEGEKS